MRRTWPILASTVLAAAVWGCAAQTSRPPVAGTDTVASAPRGQAGTTIDPLPSTPPDGSATASDAGVTASPTIVSATITAPPSASPTVSATATPAISGTPDVTLADNGQSIQLRVGKTFLLKLGSNFNWTVTIVDQAIVSRVRNVTVIRGAQGLYRALHPGSTTLTATGDPPCRSATPACAAPSLFFHLAIAVTG